MENNDKIQKCHNLAKTYCLLVVSFIQELKLEWCKSKEQHKSF
jgi:hypothetical protein